MQLDHLFDDLEAQLARGSSVQEADLAAEAERLRLGSLHLSDRLIAVHEASRGASYRLAVSFAGGMRATFAPTSIGREWMLAELLEGSGVTAVVSLEAIDLVSLTPGQVRASLNASPRGARSHVGLNVVLRDLCRRRRYLEVLTADTVLRGTIDRVGRDHFDLALHEPPRRSTAVSEVCLVPLTSFVLAKLL